MASNASLANEFAVATLGPAIAKAQPSARKLPPLNALKAFDAVARLGSVRRAATELSVSHAVVGRHVRNLEFWVGVKLVAISNSGTDLTSEGKRFHHNVSAGLQLLEEATTEVRPNSSYQEMRIWCAPGFAKRWLMPRIRSLEEELGNCEIILRPAYRVPNYTRREADVTIVFESEPGLNIRSELLMTPRLFPVASPAFLQTIDLPRTVADLANVELIHEDNREQWRQWFQCAGIHQLPSLRGLRLGNADMVLDAAIMGQGIGLTNVLLAGDAIRKGQLVELLDTDITIGSYNLHCLNHRWTDPVIVRLRRWLSHNLANDGVESQCTTFHR